MPHTTPGEVELYAFYRKHLGGRFEAAGLRVQFHYNQTPGIHFKVIAPEEYTEAITTGLQDGLAVRFPHFPSSGSVWILEITEDAIDSSQRAFYNVSRIVIDQAFLLAESAAIAR